MIFLNVRFVLALFSVMVLSILPSPDFLYPFRPSFVLLLLMYVQFFTPRNLNLLFVLGLGLCLDVLLASVLGEHVFALMMTSWFMSGKARRFNFFPIGQQMILILLFCMLYQSLLFVISVFLGEYYNPMTILFSSLVGMLFWPWIRIMGNTALISRPAH